MDVIFVLVSKRYNLWINSLRTQILASRTLHLFLQTVIRYWNYLIGLSIIFYILEVFWLHYSIGSYYLYSSRLSYDSRDFPGIVQRHCLPCSWSIVWTRSGCSVWSITCAETPYVSKYFGHSQNLWHLTHLGIFAHVQETHWSVRSKIHKKKTCLCLCGMLQYLCPLLKHPILGFIHFFLF